MPTAKLYFNFITRNKRFANQNALLDYEALIHDYLEVDVDGCQITNTSSYVDISFSTSTLVKAFDLFRCSYVKFTNTIDQKEYLAFVDRVEPSNFNTYNENGLYRKAYRLFVTVDWWSSIMWNDTPDKQDIKNIKHYLEGTTIRAHVNDVHLKDVQNSEYVFGYDMSYTTFSPEFPISKLALTKGRIGGGSGRRFLYIMSTEKFDSYSVISPTLCGDRSIPNPLYLYVTALDSPLPAKIESENTSTGEIISRQFVVWCPNPEIITDSSVVSLFVSDYCPYYNSVKGIIEASVPRSEGPISPYQQPVQFECIGGYEANAWAIPNELPPKSYRNPAIKTYNTNVQKPANYEEYLGVIAKQYFTPYTSVYISTGQSRIQLDTSTIDSDVLFEYSVLPSVGGYIIKTNEQSRVNQAQYNVLSAGGLFERTGTDDEFTQNKRTSMILSEISNHFAMSQTLVNSAASKQYGQTTATAINMFASPYETASEYSKMLRDGETGYTTQSTALNAYLSPFCFEIKRLNEAEIDELRFDLALYGYNTFLHPHNVLEEHKRRYFNYIKTTNATINLGLYTKEIRLQIEEMFNNGVWLWNTYELFGNFEVPNYPILMDGVMSVQEE